MILISQLHVMELYMYGDEVRGIYHMKIFNFSPCQP